MGSRHRNDIALHLLRHWHRHRHRRLCPRRRLVSTTLFPFHFIFIFYKIYENPNIVIMLMIGVFI